MISVPKLLNRCLVALTLFACACTVMASEVAAKKSNTRENSSIIFDGAGNVIFTSNNIIIGSAVNFQPAKNLRLVMPSQIISSEEPDDPMGPPDPREPKPPKVPDYTEPQPKPQPKPSCQNGPGCPISFRNGERLIKYGPDVRGINLYKLEKGIISKEAIDAGRR